MAKSVTSLTRIVRQFRRRTIGVLGDFMLDELLRGEATRIPWSMSRMGAQKSDRRLVHSGDRGSRTVTIRGNSSLE